MLSSERASQEKQNGANFSFVVPSSEELHVCALKEFVVHVFGLKLNCMLAIATYVYVYVWFV